MIGGDRFGSHRQF